MRKTNKFFEVPNFRFLSKVKGFGKKVAVAWRDSVEKRFCMPKQVIN